MILEGIGAVFGWAWWIGIVVWIYFLVQWIRGVHPWWYFGIAFFATFLCKRLGTEYVNESSRALHEHDMENED
jgi:hypothetical protein